MDVIRSVTLAVADLEGAVRFCGEALGLEARVMGDAACVPPSTCTLRLVGAPDVAAHGDSHVFHVALRLGDERRFASFVRWAMERWDVEGLADHLVSESIYLKDPNGIGFEIYVDRPRRLWPRNGDMYIMDTRPLDLKRVLSLSSEPRPLPPDISVGHVHLRTPRVGEAERFYRELGFRVTGRWMGAVFMAWGDYHHHLAFNSWPLPRPRGNIVAIRFGFPASAVDPMGIRIE